MRDLPLRCRAVDPRADRQLRAPLLLRVHHGVGQGRDPMPPMQAAVPVDPAAGRARDLRARARRQHAGAESGQLICFCFVDFVSYGWGL